MHAAHRLIARERGFLELSAHRDLHRPFEANGEHRMRNNAANCVHVAGERVAKRGGIGHRPSRIDLADHWRTGATDDRRLKWHSSYIYAPYAAASTASVAHIAGSRAATA